MVSRVSVISWQFSLLFTDKNFFMPFSFPRSVVGRPSVMKLYTTRYEVHNIAVIPNAVPLDRDGRVDHRQAGPPCRR